MYTVVTFLLILIASWVAFKLASAENKIDVLEIDLKDRDKQVEYLTYYLDLINYSLSVEIKMNNIFGNYKIDSERLEEEHIILLRPYFEKHGFNALIAYTSLKRGKNPIPHIATDEKYKLALAELSLSDIFVD